MSSPFLDILNIRAGIGFALHGGMTPRLLFAVFIVLQAADGWLTYEAVDLFGHSAEGNPILATWMHLTGLGPALVEDAAIHPDPLALQDDLSRAAAALSAGPDAAGRHYLAGFVLGVAHHAHDSALARAARAAGVPDSGDLDQLRGLIDKRLTRGSMTAAFAAKPESA